MFGTVNPNRINIGYYMKKQVSHGTILCLHMTQTDFLRIHFLHFHLIEFHESLNFKTEHRILGFSKNKSVF